MVQETEMETEFKDLRSKVQDKKVVIGAERVLKGVKARQVASVYLAKNCPMKVKEDVEYYAKLGGIPVISMNYTNEELGVFCKKNFFVAILAISA